MRWKLKIFIGRSSLSIACRRARRFAPRNRAVGKFRSEARIDLAGKSPDSDDRILVVEMSGLPHDQQIPEAADMVIEVLDLLEDAIGGAEEHRAIRDRGVDGGVETKITEAAAGRVTQHHLHIGGDRAIAGRISEPGRDLVRGDVPEQLLSAGARFRLIVGDIDHGGIGEAIDRDIVAFARLAPALAIGIIDRGGSFKAGEEGRLDEAMRADLRRTARARRADPDRWMRLLIRPRPDIDVAVMEEAALEAGRTVMA